MHVEEQVFGVKMERLDEVGLKCPSDIHIGSGECGRELRKVRARSADLQALAGKTPREAIGRDKREPRTKARDMPPGQRIGVRLGGWEEDGELEGAIRRAWGGRRG